jgi:hypothetical protein
MCVCVCVCVTHAAANSLEPEFRRDLCRVCVHERAPKFAERTCLRACTRVVTRVRWCLVITASRGLRGCVTHAHQFAGTRILMCVSEPPSAGGEKKSARERAPKFAERTCLCACTRVVARVLWCLVLATRRGLRGCVTHASIRWNPNFGFVCCVRERAPKHWRGEKKKVRGNEPPSLPSARVCVLARVLWRACVGASCSPRHGAHDGVCDACASLLEPEF